VDDSLNNWFAREILVHEGALMRYLLRTWFRREEIHDLRQEIYVRVYESAAKARPTQPKSFMFTIARHLNVLIDEITPERRMSARQELRRLTDAFDRLPNRCREVVWLRRVEELSQKQVAARMGISEKTVEKQVAKGSRLIAEYFYGGTPVHGLCHGKIMETDDENGHGQQRAD
jgi:DNA-directed RNA polymerase specialized sigma24 family protein